MITFSEHGSDTFASSTRGVADKNMSQQSQVFKLETGNVSEAPLYLIATTEDYASSPQTQQSGTTRGTEVTGFDSFGWFALDGTSAVYENSEATSAGSVFTTSEYWPADLLATPSKTYGFLAYYPRLTSTSYGLTLDVSARTITYDATSASVAEQQDLMAAFTTRGYSGGDAVPLEFKHLCTAVRIKTASDFTHTVKRVVFKNIFTTGVCSLTSTAPYHIWNATVQSTDYEVYNDATGVTGGGNDVLTGSSTLFMIPQSFTSSNQMIEVVINDGTTDRTLTTTLNGSEWIAGKVVTYTISRSAITALTSLTVEYPLWKNSSNDNVYGPVFRYEGDDYFGLFAVDNSTHEIFRSNVKVGVSFGSTTATCNLAGIEPQHSEGYTYYIMYPYRESVPEGLAVGATFSGSTADEFFSSVISGWEPSATQNTLAMHKAQDLQVSKVVIDGQAATAKMAHKMGLAKVVLGTKSVTTSTVRTYSTQSTTHNVYTTTVSASTDVTATSKLSDQTALRLLDAAALTGDGGLWTIVKASGPAVTLNSVSNDDDAWATSISVSGISAGHYQVGCPVNRSKFR
ncbi:MAG: fimbrillin family protein [Prevotella sp.]|nr:fimbrillin family protein [Prevotella sp.]